MKSWTKVFLMAVVGFLITTISTLENFNIWYVVLTTGVFAVTYWLKNKFLPSDSEEGIANWKDIVSGLLVAVCMAISILAADLLTGTAFSAHVLWITVLGAVTGYFTKTIPQGAQVSK